MTKGIRAGLAGLLLFLCCALPVFAAPSVPEGDVSLQIKLAYEGEPLSGVSVTLHRVADISSTSPWITFTLAGCFENYPVDLVNLDNQGWASAAYTLASYAAADGISPDAVGMTAADGYASFSGLQEGLYLAQASRITDAAGYIYTAAPVLLELPRYDVNLQEWNVQAEAVMKVERENPPDTSTTEIQVYKIWESEGVSRPSSVVVDLVEDGKVVKSVTLDETNYWRHAFIGLDSEKKYHVVERSVPQGYTVSIAQSENRYTITNTAGYAPEESAELKNTGSQGGMIPQTGLLWWPVPVLAIIGLLLFGLGWKWHNDKNSTD